MGVYVVIKPDGTEERVEGGKKIDIHKLYELIGCRTVELTPVEYDGRKRDCWLDEEGLLVGGHHNPVTGEWVNGPQFNPRVRSMAVDYWIKHGVMPSQVQHFAGIGVVWLPKG